MSAQPEGGGPAGGVELSSDARQQLLGFLQRLDPGEIDVRTAGGELYRPRRCASYVEPRSLADRPWRDDRAPQADGAPFKEYGVGLGPESAEGGDELLRPIVAAVVIDLLAEALEVALDSAGHDVEVNAAAAYLIESGRHLGEEPCGDEPGPDRDEKTDAACDRRQCSDCRPGLGEGSAFLEEAVAEPRGDE